MAALLVALAGCDLRLQVALPTPPGAPTPAAPAATAALPPPAGGYPAVPEGLTGATVVRVIDGDTIVVAIRGREERVRLIGINTPETVDPRRPVQCYGAEASASAKAMLEGQAVLLEDDASQDSRDSSGRLLRYVWLADGRMVNLEQVALGFAAEYTYDRPYRYRDIFRAAQREASDAGRGLWAPDTCGGRFAPLGEGQAPAATAGPAESVASCPRAPASPGAPDAPVRIVGLDKGGETVRLANVGPDPVSLDGWVLCSVRGGESQAGLGGDLAPGEARGFTNPGAPIWSNSNRDDAALYDPAGRLVSYWEDR